MIFVANALNLGTDPQHPQWDTMLALRNTGLLPVYVTITLGHDDGSSTTLPTVTIKPGLMWAASFIPGNGFPSVPPIGWQGDLSIVCLKATPLGLLDATSDIVPFFLLSFNGWHNGINAPFRKSIDVSSALVPKNLWQFAYAIPYFDDTTGDTGRKWTTGVKINNRSAQTVSGKLIYTIGQNYAEAGQAYTIPFSIGPSRKLTFDLYLGNSAQGVLGLKDVDYPAPLNSEGHFDIITDTNALLQPSALIADAQYDFTVTEDFSG